MVDTKITKSGIIDMYSKSKGSVQVDNTWYSPGTSIVNEIITRANSGEFKKGFMAVMELTSPGVNVFKSIEIKDPKEMSASDVAKTMTPYSEQKTVMQKPVEKFGMIALTEENFEETLKKGKLMLKLAKALRDNYMNETNRTELKEAELEMINSCLKAILWGK